MGSLSSLHSICSVRGCFIKYQDEVKNSMVKKLSVRASVATSVPLNFQVEENKAHKLEKFRIGVLGASGYTGSEIIRLLANHPNYQITLMTADRKAGQSIGAVFPHLVKQEIIKSLPSSLKIVDLSAESWLCRTFGFVISMKMRNGTVNLIGHRNYRSWS